MAYANTSLGNVEVGGTQSLDRICFPIDSHLIAIACLFHVVSLATQYHCGELYNILPYSAPGIFCLLGGLGFISLLRPKNSLLQADCPQTFRMCRTILVLPQPLTTECRAVSREEAHSARKQSLWLSRTSVYQASPMIQCAYHIGCSEAVAVDH